MATSLLLNYFRQSWSKVPYKSDNEENVIGKVVVVTGANSGIGEAVAFELAKRGAIVVMACRDMAKAKKVEEKMKTQFPDSKIDLLELDLGDLNSVRKCAEAIRAKYEQIDILINNAGIAFEHEQLYQTKDGFEMHMGVNHLGHFLFTLLLIDMLKKAAPSRIVNVASSTFLVAELDLDDIFLEKRGTFGLQNMGPYSNSKLANIYFTRSLAKKLTGTGVTVYALCPGIVSTDIGRSNETSLFRSAMSKFQKLISLTPEQGAETILYCSLSKSCTKETGIMYRFCKPFENMPNLDDDAERRLWEKSTELVGLKSDILNLTTI